MGSLTMALVACLEAYTLGNEFISWPLVACFTGLFRSLR